MNPPEQSRSAEDASSLFERIENLFDERMRRGDLEYFELYARHTIALRLSRWRPAESRSRFGIDDGLAVRLRLRGEQGMRFSATSGSGRRALDRAVYAACSGSPFETCEAGSRPGPTRVIEDLDPLPEEPLGPAAARWLGEAWESSADAGLAPRAAWVEQAITTEVWVSSEGIRAQRRRARGWALLEPGRSSASGGFARPMIAASRRFEALDPRVWCSRNEALRASPAGARSTVGRRIDVELAPEPAARLAHALVRAFSVGRDPRSGSSPQPVGPGWSVEDSPRDADALFGGLFDDSAFPTGSRRLADGKWLVDRLDGPGQLRRASFRDPPEPLPSQIVVRPLREAALRDGIRATELRVHGLGSTGWILEIEGVRIAGGETAGTTSLFVRAAPTELLERCVAGRGRPVGSYLGVSTPALLFHDLEVAR